MTTVAHGTRGDVAYAPDGYSCNMGYVVVRDGRVVYRGPRWQAHRVACTGVPFAEQRD